MTDDEQKEYEHHLEMQKRYAELVGEHALAAQKLLAKEVDGEDRRTYWERFVDYWTGPYY